MRNVIKHRFPRILAMAVLVPCLLAGFVQAASTRDFPSVARAVDADHAAAIQARVATEKKIQKKRAAMARQIQNLETMLSWARQEQAAEEARLTDLSARRDALKKEIAARLSRKEELEVILRDTARNLLVRAETVRRARNILNAQPN